MLLSEVRGWRRSHVYGFSTRSIILVEEQGRRGQRGKAKRSLRSGSIGKALVEAFGVPAARGQSGRVLGYEGADVARSADTAQECKFGLSLAAAAAVLAVVARWRGRPVLADGAALAGLLLGALALGVPAWLRRPRVAWMAFAHVLGAVNTCILLAAVFVLVLLPAGLIARFAGWDPLGRRRRRAPAGWVAYPARRRDSRHYEKLY
jgi:saxitoxin biosynthesis operon SxtJ-like protein